MATTTMMTCHDNNDVEANDNVEENGNDNDNNDNEEGEIWESNEMK